MAFHTRARSHRRILMKTLLVGCASSCWWASSTSMSGSRRAQGPAFVAAPKPAANAPAPQMGGAVGAAAAAVSAGVSWISAELPAWAVTGDVGTAFEDVEFDTSRTIYKDTAAGGVIRKFEPLIDGFMDFAQVDDIEEKLLASEKIFNAEHAVPQWAFFVLLVIVGIAAGIWGEMSKLGNNVDVEAARRRGKPLWMLEKEEEFQEKLVKTAKGDEAMERRSSGMGR
mmetsp:Transcript_172649/g.553281  ORF Transcript_172649/g.553281 Transcript_172649/m.553281 type:complete len:226 (+) Transcript_172649:128-805(+)